MRYLFSRLWNNNTGDIMKDEVELLNYLGLNLKIHIDWLLKICEREKLSEDEERIILDNVSEYKKFQVSINRMILAREKKGIKEASVFADVASTIGAINIVRKNENILELIVESSKINLLDINRVKEEYNVQSKTILNLILRLENYEKNNIERIIKIMAKK